MEENLRILKPFLRGLPITIIVMVIFILGAKKYLGYVTPMYESTAKIKLADIGEGIPNSNLYKNFDVFSSRNKIDAEIEVLKSSLLIGKTIKDLGFIIEIYRVGKIQRVELFNDSPIKISLAKDSGTVYDKRFTLKVISNEKYEILDVDKKIIIQGVFEIPISFLDNIITISKNHIIISKKKNIKIIDNYEFECFSKDKLIDKINTNIDIIAVDKDVPVIRINLKSNIPNKACAFVNKLAETYIQDYIENKYIAANTTVNFLENQIKNATEKLSQSENQIEDYRNTNDIVNIKQETETDLRKISQLKIQQTNLKMNLKAIDNLDKYITTGKENFLSLAPNFEAFTDLLSTEIIKNIKKLQSEKKDLLLIYTSNDDRVTVIDEKLKDLTSYLIESIKNTRQNLQIKYDEISFDITEAEKTFETVPLKEKNMTILTRDFDLLQQSYNFLNEKKIEAEIAQAAKISFHRIITPALVSKQPISPNRPIIIILTGMLGLFFSIVIIYSVHFLKAKVNEISSIESNSTIPIAVSTPYFEGYDYKIFQKIVLQLELKGILKKNNILAITSFNQNEGKGYNLINICKTLDIQNRKVIIIDLQGDLTLLERFQTENILYTNLNRKEYDIYTNEQIEELILHYKSQTEFIIINNEFLKEETKSLLIMKLSDANLFVVDTRITPLKMIKRLEYLKDEFDIKNTFFIVNKLNYNPNVIKDIICWLKKHSFRLRK